MEPTSNPRTGGFRTFVARLAVLTLVVWIGSSVLSPFDDLKFDQTVWHQYSGYSDPRSPRGRMYEDLESILLRTRPSREDVLQILGEPDAPAREQALEYSLGAWSGFRIDFDTMVIAFDASGDVSHVSRVQG